MINPFIRNATIQIKDEALTGGKWRTYTVAEVLREGLGYLRDTTLILTPTVPMNLRSAPMSIESMTTREARLRRERGEATKREAPYTACTACQRAYEDETDEHTLTLEDRWAEGTIHAIVDIEQPWDVSTGLLSPGSAPGLTYPVLSDAEFAKLAPAWGRP